MNVWASVLGALPSQFIAGNVACPVKVPKPSCRFPGLRTNTGAMPCQPNHGGHVYVASARVKNVFLFENKGFFALRKVRKIGRPECRSPQKTTKYSVCIENELFTPQGSRN
jgi:hypothetical protein